MKVQRAIVCMMIFIILCFGLLCMRSVKAENTCADTTKNLQLLEAKNCLLEKQLQEQRDFTKELLAEVDGLRAELVLAQKAVEEAEPEVREEFGELEILAKLLFCEAGGASRECQIYVCSAILNLADRSDRSIWDMAHDINTMAVAPYVDSAVPNSTQYEVIEEVLYEGARIDSICYFRTSYYHSFGTPICEIDGVYFSAP